MSQGSYLENKNKKRKFDDAGYEENPKQPKKQKQKKDFSQERQRKRGDL